MSIGYNENDIPNRNTALAASSQISADAAAIANQKAMEENIAPAKKGAKAATRKYDPSGGLISRSDQPSAVYQPTASTAASGGNGKKIVNTFTRFDGKQIGVYDDGTIVELGQSVDTVGQRKSAFDILKTEFTQYGLGDLIGDSLELATQSVGPNEFALTLRAGKAYTDRFSANAERIKKGLSALSPAEYIKLEDQYQSTMRSYGLPADMYTTGKAGRQPGLEKFITGDVSPVELEDRIQLAVNKVQNASPDVLQAFEKFYPGVNKANLVAYVLNPELALPTIRRQIQSAEIGGAAMQSGFNLGQKPEEIAGYASRASELAAAGVTRERAQEGYQAIAGGLQRGAELSAIYGENAYTQKGAEQELFNLSGGTEYATQRKRLASKERATFGGQSGVTSGALKRDRAGGF